MTRSVDLLIVGAGPAGMSSAIVAKRHGLEVLVVDEQPAPGGQIWRNIESIAGTQRATLLGTAYADGAAVVSQFRQSGVLYEPETQVWHIDAGTRAFLKRNGMATSVDTRWLLLATGAQERPVPFPGWTLPGVMTVGAAQIVLKSSGQIPSDPVWIAGTGPLPLLYAVQLLQAGGKVAGFLDTTPPGRASAALSKLPSALFGAVGDIFKGLGWLASLKRRTLYVRNVTEIEAIGDETLERIRYTTADGRAITSEARLLLVHEGLVPTIHPTLGIGCRHEWNSGQDSFSPELNDWGETSERNIFVAGDGAGIGGAVAACLGGEIAALRIAAIAGRISEAEAAATAKPIRSQLARALSARPFLDAY